MTDEEYRHQFSPWRIGSTPLSSCPSKPNNIDISPSGAVLTRCDESVDIVNVRHGGLAPFLKSDDHFVHHRDAAKRTETFHSSIFIGDVPTVGINGRVGKDGKVDLTTYEKRFIHAEWAPLEIGPNASPFFATLTTRRDLHLWYAPDNQFTGPWQCLASLSDPNWTDGLDIAVSSFTFLDPGSVNIDHQTVHLMATCQDENRAIIWAIQPLSIIGGPVQIHKVYDGVPAGYDLKETYLLRSVHLEKLQIAEEKQDHFIAVIGPKGLVTMRFDSEKHELKSNLWANEKEEGSYSSIFANTNVYHAQWSERTLCLYLCTSGQLFEVNFHLREKGKGLPAYVRLIFTAVDKDGEQIPNLKPVVGLQLHQGTQHEMTITLKDGTMYRCKEGFTQKKQAILPAGEIEAPNSELQGLQRDIEKKRGMYAFQSDDCGVAFLNFDNNDVSAWSFIQHPTSTLEVAFTEAQVAGLNQSEVVGPLSRAQAIMFEFVHLENLYHVSSYHLDIPLQSIARRSKLIRFLSLHTERSIDKAPIFQHCRIAIAHCKEEEPLRLASALQLNYWLKSFNSTEMEKGMFAEVCEDIEILELRLAFESIQNRIKSVIDILKGHGTNDFSDACEMQCLRFAAIAFCLAKRMDEGIGTIKILKSLLSTLKGTEMGSTLIHEWERKIKTDSQVGIDVGEHCPICDVAVLVGPHSLFEARCTNGHKWNRCSTTFGILCNVRAAACIVCCHQSILPDDAIGTLQTQELLEFTRCALCGGTKVIV